MHHQLCTARSTFSSRKAGIYALAAHYYRLTNGRKGRALDTKSEREPSKDVILAFVERCRFINFGLMIMRSMVSRHNFVAKVVDHVIIPFTYVGSSPTSLHYVF